jgi:hypothetical protein
MEVSGLPIRVAWSPRKEPVPRSVSRLNTSIVWCRQTSFSCIHRHDGLYRENFTFTTDMSRQLGWCRTRSVLFPPEVLLPHRGCAHTVDSAANTANKIHLPRLSVTLCHTSFCDVMPCCLAAGYQFSVDACMFLQMMVSIYKTTRCHISVDYSLKHLDDQVVGVGVPVGLRIFSSPNRPDRLWGSPNLLSSGYRELFPRG